MEKEINIIIRNVARSEDLDVVAPISAKSIDIIETLIENGCGDSTDESGRRIQYKLTPKGGSRELKDHDTLEENGIQEGDLILLVPVFKSGDVGQISISIPGQIDIGCRVSSSVKISRTYLEDIQEKDSAIIEDIEVELVEISDVMACSMQENAIRSHLEIISINSEEQFFGNKGLLNWRFDLVPFSLGLTSVVLKVSIIKAIKDIGEKRKDVFLFDKEIFISGGSEIRSENHYYTDINIGNVDDLCKWNTNRKQRIVNLISKGELGLALNEFANFSQGSGIELFNSIILLQARFNHSKNRFKLGVLTEEDWETKLSKMNLTLLDLINEVDKSKWENEDIKNKRIKQNSILANEI